MKFEDKLIDLRKKAGLSQEALAEKLGVTRQTISKWEVGETKPDMDKLKEMSKLYNVNIDELINDEKNIKVNENNNIKSTESTKKRKWILYIVIVLLIGCIGTLAYRLYSSAKENKNSSLNSLVNVTNNSSISNTINEVRDSISVSSFNSSLEIGAGNNSAFILETYITKLITSNSKNADHQITLVFDGTSYTNSEDITNIKNNLDDDFTYDMSFKYDDNGYINEMIITKVISTSKFNIQFTSASWGFGDTIKSLINDIVTSNNKFADHQVEFVLNGTSYGTDTTKISNVKNSLGEWTKYYITYEYDANGYINKTIVTE